MKKIVLRLLSVTSFLLLLGLSAKTAQAQTFTCYWDTNFSSCFSNASQNGCIDFTVTNNYCLTLPQGTCPGTRNCSVLSGGNTPTPTTPPGATNTPTPLPASGQSPGCSSFTVTPSSGDFTTQFVLQGSGCQRGKPPDDGDFIIRILDSFGNYVTSAGGTVSPPSFSINIPFLSSPGTYSVVAQTFGCTTPECQVYCGGSPCSTSFTIASGPTPPGGIPCNIPVPNFTICPLLCPVLSCGGAGDCRCITRASILPMLCDSDTGIKSAIGCIPITETQRFTEFLLRWAMGIAGGIAILLIAYAGFMITTSAGNPQKLQAGKELLEAALMGLGLLIFGAFLLNLIGVQILKLPGFPP